MLCYCLCFVFVDVVFYTKKQCIKALMPDSVHDFHPTICYKVQLLLSSVHVTKNRISSPLDVFLKNGQLGFSKATESISDYTGIQYFLKTFEFSDFFLRGSHGLGA